MKDLHSHLLYGIDDGCKTIDESIELIRKMLESGFNKIVLTPHYISNSDYNSNRENNLKIFNELRQKVLDNNLNVQLYLGNEIYLDNNSLTLLKNGTLSSIANTKYILFELPLGNQVRNVLDLLIPPCAAIECARRGLSWIQKLSTLNPISASEAAAEAPASPVPTTMMSRRRLLAGFTSF